MTTENTLNNAHFAFFQDLTFSLSGMSGKLIEMISRFIEDNFEGRSSNEIDVLKDIASWPPMTHLMTMTRK